MNGFTFQPVDKPNPPVANWRCPGCNAINLKTYNPAIEPDCEFCDYSGEWEEGLDEPDLILLQEELDAIDYQDHKRGLYGDD